MQGEKNVCIIPAAGRGIRFSRDLPKSFYPIEGRTLLARSIAAVAAWGGVSRFVVMVLSGMEDRARETLAPELEEIEYSVHAGGETRQESVARGLAEVGEADLVLVHDASRPVFSVPMVERIVKAAREYGAAVPVLQVTDSIARDPRRGDRERHPPRPRRRDTDAAGLPARRAQESLRGRRGIGTDGDRREFPRPRRRFPRPGGRGGTLEHQGDVQGRRRYRQELSRGGQAGDADRRRMTGRRRRETTSNAAAGHPPAVWLPGGERER